MVVSAIFIVAVGYILFTKSGYKTQQIENTNTDITETTSQKETAAGSNEGFTDASDEQPGCEIEKEVSVALIFNYTNQKIFINIY